MTSQTTSTGLYKKATTIIFFLLLFYVLPLLVKPELILNWRVIFLAAVCSIIFSTQPRLSIAESKENKSTDKNTIWLIIGVSGIGQIVSLIEWAYFPYNVNLLSHRIVPCGYDSNKVEAVITLSNYLNWTILGAILLLSGTIFRLYARNVLGKYFSSTVQIKNEQKIISTGPYKFIRHPSYTGAYIAMLGSAIFLHSFIGILIFGVGMLFVYHLRIKTEEHTLINNFKQDYLNYREHTYKMFPLIW